MGDFQKTLLEVAQALGSADTKAVAFLCADYLPQMDPGSVETATEVFRRLMDKGILSEEQPYLLADLLYAIGNIRVLRECNLTHMLSTTRSIICPYRKLLYILSENITTGHLNSIKFLLMDQLPGQFQETRVSTLEVFRELERKGHLSSLDLSLLEKTLRTVCPVLLEKIQQFKDSYGQQITHLKGPISQETGGVNMRPRSSSDVSTSHAKIRTPDRPNSEYTGRQKFYHQVSSLQISNTTSESSTDPPSPIELQASSGPPDPPAAESQREDVVLYPMAGHRRGVCWIVNNYDFGLSSGKFQKREGTQLDEKRLRCVFTWLGFEVEVIHNTTRQQMLSSLRELAQRDHGGGDCMACVVLSHGGPHCVYGVDGKEVKLDELMELVGGKHCVTLRGKPKLLFIQACQGDETQEAVCIQADGPDTSPSDPARGSICSDAVPHVVELVPWAADILLGMATVPAYTSLRHRHDGTWYIKSLCQNLLEMVPRGRDLISILLKVNADVSNMVDPRSSKRQIPMPSFSLRWSVVFPVPAEPSPVLPTSL